MRIRALSQGPLPRRRFSSALGLSLGLAGLAALSSPVNAHAQSAPAPASSTSPASTPPRQPEPDNVTGARSLTFEEALDLGIKQNRDLQAARERLRGSHADVERALATLLPTVTAQGKVTVNFPEVSLALDQSGSVFNSIVQGAQIVDLNTTAGTNPSMGPATQAVLNLVCNDPASSASVQGVCQSYRGGAGMNLGNIPATLAGANILATITPRVQLDAVIAANIPLVVPHAYPALEGAKLNFKAQQKQLEVTAAQILQSVATSFYAAAGNEEVLTARRHAIEVAQKTVDNTRVRLSAGVVNRVEVTRAELALIQAQQRLLEAQDARLSAYRTLATLLKIPAGSFKVVPPSETKTDNASAEQLVDTALKQRPELANFDLSIQANTQQIKSQWLRWAPTLSAFGNIRLTNATGFAGRPDYYAIGLQLDWTIFDGLGRDAQRHQYEAVRRDNELRLEQLRETVADEVISGRRAVATRQVGLATAQRSLQMAQETLNLVRIQYEAGTATQLDLLTAQDTAVTAEVGLAQARFDLSLTVLNLKKITGAQLN